MLRLRPIGGALFFLNEPPADDAFDEREPGLLDFEDREPGLDLLDFDDLELGLLNRRPLPVGVVGTLLAYTFSHLFSNSLVIAAASGTIRFGIATSDPRLA